MNKKFKEDLPAIIILVSIIGLFTLVGGVASCTNYYFPELEGPHQLRQLKQNTEKGWSAGGSTFFGFHAGSYEKTYIHFYWKHPTEGSYIYGEFRIEKVRIIINNEIKTPTVTFKGSSLSNQRYDDIDKFINYDILYRTTDYIIITCKDTHVPERFSQLGLYTNE